MKKGNEHYIYIYLYLNFYQHLGAQKSMESGCKTKEMSLFYQEQGLSLGLSFLSAEKILQLSVSSTSPVSARYFC